MFWLARNKNGKIRFFISANPPIKSKYGFWYIENGEGVNFTIYKHRGYFKNIRWEDDKPTKVTAFMTEDKGLHDLPNQYI